MTPGFLSQTFLISQFELKRLFNTRKGLLFLLTFSVVWYFILLYPIRFSADIFAQNQNSTQGSSFFEFIGFGALLNWKIPEFGVYWRFALLMFPILCITITADQTCSDRERGTLRFLYLRASRDSLFFGRFMGVMAIQMLLILITVFTSLLLVIFRDSNLLLSSLSSAVAISINLTLILLPFTAMMATLSACISSSRLATIWAILIWSFLAGIISSVSYYLPALEILKILIPGYQMTQLSELAEWQTFQLAYIPILQSMVLLGIGRWVMTRQSL